MRTSRPKARHGECKKVGIIRFKRSDQKRKYFIASPLFCFSRILPILNHHLLLQDKLVVYTMMREEPPQLSLLLPLQG